MSQHPNSNSSNNSEFVRAMGPVARALMGDPTEENKAKRELRFGTRGSLSVDLTKGTWFDNEANKGGGVIAFVCEKKRVDKAAAVEWLKEQGHLPKSDRASRSASKRQVATYDYLSEGGELLFQVVRFEPKDFRPRHPDGKGGWAWSMAGVDRVLYQLPSVSKAVREGRRIYIAEGEKGVDALFKLGVVATCSPGGANKWRSEYSRFLKGAEVVILPDNDEPGRQHAASVAKSLHGIAAKVLSIAIPGLPEKGDIADWIAAGGTREALEAFSPAEAPTEAPAANEGTSTDEAPSKEEIQAAISAMVEDFNNRFMVVNEAGKAVIFQPGYDAALGRRRFDRLSIRDLQTLYMNQTMVTGIDEKGRIVCKTKSDIWLRHTRRRQYIHGVTFDPTATAEQPGVLNLWEGFAVQPSRGDWSLLKSHIERVICDGDPVRFTYLMGWMARMFQHPAEQGEVAVVMKGGEGTGKGTLAKALMKIMGHHGLAISNSKHLVGNFNAHLRDVIFLFADEALFAGDRAHVGALKSLITEPYLTVEGKFQNAIQAPNFLHVMMASNEEWVVPASQDARRFFVLEVSEKAKGDHAYFAAIWKQMEAGGYAGMLHELLNTDLSTFNVRSVPSTAGLQRQKKLSLGTTDAWWLDCLERGYVFRSRLGLEDAFAAWHSTISTELLFASYMEFAKSRGERRILTRENLGRFLTEIGGVSTRWRNGVVGEHLTDVEGPFGGTIRKAKVVKAERTMGYRVGTLDDARAEFVRKTGLPVAWQGGNDEADVID
jgi:hypothetical protein